MEKTGFEEAGESVDITLYEAARAAGLFTGTYPSKEDEMELDINTLIPIGTFAVSMIWLAVVVLFEHYTTAK